MRKVPVLLLILSALGIAACARRPPAGPVAPAGPTGPEATPARAGDRWTFAETPDGIRIAVPPGWTADAGPAAGKALERFGEAQPAACRPLWTLPRPVALLRRGREAAAVAVDPARLDRPAPDEVADILKAHRQALEILAGEVAAAGGEARIRALDWDPDLPLLGGVRARLDAGNCGPEIRRWTLLGHDRTVTLVATAGAPLEEIVARSEMFP